MNLNQLRVFHVAAKLQSFTAAAQSLCLTQPGVSKHIKDLEGYYGTCLFDRIGKKIFLTQAGSVLYAKTEAIFDLLDHAREELDELKGLRRGKLTIGASTTLAVYIMPGILQRFKSLHPQVDISLDIAVSQ